MALTLTPINHGSLCHGWHWTVGDLDLLAERVARVAMGQYRHVAQILDGLNVAPPAGKKDFAANAIQKLRVAKNGDPWQRDGWIFQIISWIAANQQKQKAILKPPHIFHAHKGFDGMQLEISEDGKSIIAVIVFEDKATEDPRTTIRDDVWPAIVKLEQGERVAELTHEATALLETQQHVFANLDVDAAIDRIFWQQDRRYRVSISTSKTHAAEDARKRLFADYDESAPGDVVRRRAETMHFDDLRDWMSKFADLVIKKIEELTDV